MITNYSSTSTPMYVHPSFNEVDMGLKYLLSKELERYEVEDRKFKESLFEGLLRFAISSISNEKRNRFVVYDRNTGDVIYSDKEYNNAVRLEHKLNEEFKAYNDELYGFLKRDNGNALMISNLILMTGSWNCSDNFK